MQDRVKTKGPELIVRSRPENMSLPPFMLAVSSRDPVQPRP